jgi:RND family efflux transporter MFP subunit
MNRKPVLAGMGLCALLVSSCGSKIQQEQSIQENVIPVKLQVLEQGKDQTAILASGQFSTDDEATLSFKNGGVISKMLVEEGDAVKAGQLLAMLDLAEIDAGVRQATLAQEKAERDYQRAYQLYHDSVATLEQMQNAQTALEIARQQLKAVAFNRRFSEIRATLSGYVLQRFANEGQVAGPGMPVLKINGAHKGDWLLKVGVSDRQWAVISEGDRAVIHSDALPGRTLDAYVFKKEEAIDPSSGTFAIHLKIRDKQTNSLASGLFARAEIYPSGHAVNSWTIPYDALLEGDAGKGFVFVTNDRRTAIKKEVKISDLRKNKVVITAGLEQAKYLIISGSPYLNEGSEIQVQ